MKKLVLIAALSLPASCLSSDSEQDKKLQHASADDGTEKLLELWSKSGTTICNIVKAGAPITLYHLTELVSAYPNATPFYEKLFPICPLEVLQETQEQFSKSQSEALLSTLHAAILTVSKNKPLEKKPSDSVKK